MAYVEFVEGFITDSLLTGDPNGPKKTPYVEKHLLSPCVFFLVHMLGYMCGVVLGGAVDDGFLGAVIGFLGMTMFTLSTAKLLSATHEYATLLVKCLFVQVAMLKLVVMLLIGVSSPHHELQGNRVEKGLADGTTC